jgi:hypothetical protein
VYYRQDLICDRCYNISIVFLPFVISFIPSFFIFVAQTAELRALFTTWQEALPPSCAFCINMNSGNVGQNIGDCHA